MRYGTGFDAGASRAADFAGGRTRLKHGRVPHPLSVESKPEVLRFGGGTDADLNCSGRSFLLRVIADAFDLPPFYLGVEADVNPVRPRRNTTTWRFGRRLSTARLLAEQSDARCDPEKAGME